MIQRNHTSIGAMVAFLLLALCAPLAEGIAFNSEVSLASRKADKQIEKHAGGRSSTLSTEAMDFFRSLENASSRRPVIMPPGDVRRALQESRNVTSRASLLAVSSGEALTGSGEFQPSEDFQRAGETQRQGEGAELPWGVGTPRTGDSWPVHEYSAMHMLDVPHWVEYSLETGDNMQTFSSAWQDVKLITQVLENVTNGFYLDTHGGDGETNSYTLLLELTGWRGMVIEPQIYEFATLWGKMRKAWLFLGCVSPTGNATKIGFDTDGVIDMESGHFIHSYSVSTFLEEMGGRKTIDFWAVHNGNYEAEVLNETFFGSGKNIEFGVVLVRFDGRRTGRGYQPYVLPRSKDATEELIFEIMHNASFNYIGGLDAYWVNYVEPRFHYKDHVWVNPAYFERRGLPVPTWCKSAPPPKLEYPRQGHLSAPGLPPLEKWTGSGSSPGPHTYGAATDLKAGAIPFKYGTPGTPYGTGEWWGGGGGGQWDPRWDWDAGYTYDQEVSKFRSYIFKAKQDATATESVAKANRVAVTRLPSVEGR